MAMHREGGSPAEMPTTGWSIFKKYINANPMSFYPLFFIFGTIPFRFIYTEPLAQSIMSMVVVIAVGIQWLGLVHQRKTLSKSHFEFDDRQLEKMIELNALSATVGLSHVSFLEPYVPTNKLRKFWNKLTKKKMLSFYSMSEGQTTSFTKYIVDEQDWFFLKLSDCIGTSDPDLLKKGQDYLKERAKRVATV